MCGTVTSFVRLSVCCPETSRKLIAQHKGVEDVCGALKQHMTAPNIVDAALSALWSLSVDGVWVWVGGLGNGEGKRKLACKREMGGCEEVPGGSTWRGKCGSEM